MTGKRRTLAPGYSGAMDGEEGWQACKT